MHRYPAAGGGSGVGNNTTGGVPRDTARPDPGFSTLSSSSLASRRPAPLLLYKLKCEQEPLNTRLGPPDFFPPAPQCAEELLSRDTCQNGYKEAVDGIEEIRETTLTLVNQHVWGKPLINKYKESIRKGLRILSNAHARKRKAGQVYGVPLSGPFLTKLGQYPEQRNCGEDYRKKWIEDLAQHKRLRILADHVPHGLRKRALFEALIKNEVPFLRATWFIKVTCLNQGGRPLSIGMSAAGGDKAQLKRLELWTKDVLEYIQPLLDELSQHGSTAFSSLGRESSPLLSNANSNQHGNDYSQVSLDGDDQSLQKKWQYMVQLVQLHYKEGLLHRAQVVEWLLKQLQEKDALDALELLLPLILNLIDDICNCQTHVRTLVDVSLQKFKALCPVGSLPDSSEHPRHLYVAAFFVELIRYLLAAVPDNFVALDCFPLPSCIYARSPALAIGWNDPGVSGDKREGSRSLLGDQEYSTLRSFQRTSSAHDVYVSYLADTVQKRAALLGKAVSSQVSHKNEGIVIQSLDQALIAGDVSAAYHCVFDEDFCGYEQLPDEWLSEVSPLNKISSGVLGNAVIPEMFAVRFLCEWAVSDFRDCRTMSNSADRKNVNSRDFCRVYMAVSVLCVRREEIRKQKCLTSSEAGAGLGYQLLSSGVHGNCMKKSREKQASGHVQSPNVEFNARSKETLLSAFFVSPGPVHDVLVAWLDQHELRRGEGFERLQLLLWELVNEGLFWPPAYVRYLTVSGLLEKKETIADLERASRHRRILQHLPGLPGLHMDDEGMGFSDPSMIEAIRLYRNEKRLALHGFDLHRPRNSRKEGEGIYQVAGQDFSKEAHNNLEACCETSDSKFSLEFLNTGCKMKRTQRKKMKVMELKQAITRCLHIPEWCAVEQSSTHTDSCTLLQSTLKKQVVLHGNISDRTEATPGCEECGRSKKQRISESKSVFSQGQGISPNDQDDRWWMKKLPKTMEAAKVEPPVSIKPPKQPSRGRPKAVRKLSLAQLAAARIEGNQEASSSHTCDSKVYCPHHKSALEGNLFSQSKESKRVPLLPDLKSVGNALKHLRLSERRLIAIWLDMTVRNLVEGNDKAAFVNSASQPSVGYGVSAVGAPAVEERGYARWQLTEEELAAILHFLDLGSDFQSLIRLLLWLLPKANIPAVSSLSSNNRPIALSWNRESSTCDVKEATILTCLRRYESVLTAAGLLPEALSAAMQRAAKVIACVPAGRVACLSLFSYVRDLYKRYSGFSSLQVWEKNWKACSDQRLIAELDALKVGDSDVNFAMPGVAVPGVGDDRDDPLPPRVVGRLKVLPFMKDAVHRGFNEVIGQMVSKEREISMSSGSKDLGIERWDEGIQAAQRVVTLLLECMRQHSGNAPHGDTQLAAAAASAVVSNVGSAVANVFETFTANNSYSCSTPDSIGSSSKCARQVLQAHIHCLRLLKEAFGERQNRGLESALASEAISVVANAIGHTSGRAPRPQFQLSPETPDPSSALVGEFGPGSNGLTLGRSSTAAGVAALVIGLVLSGVVGLERVVSLLKIKEGFENLHAFKSSSSNPNGMSRLIPSGSTLKGDNMAEVSLFWFRVLIGDCKSVAGCLVAHILSDSSLVAFTRMQRLLPLSIVLTPAYYLFSTALRSQHLSFMIGSNREDIPFSQMVFVALGELLLHDPFREICLQDTGALYSLLARDTGDLDYACLLDMKGADSYLKMSSMVPSRARLFLHALLDRKMPPLAEDKKYTQKLGSIKSHHVKELVQVLDELQPATFHWQWVELRLLLNEQVFIEKIESQNLPAAEAVQAIASAIENGTLSESEKTFTEIILTRLLVRPDAAALYSGALHLLGRALEEFLIWQVKWILKNNDMLFGRKSLRQQLEEIAHRKDFRLGYGRIKVWGWLPPQEEDCSPSKENEKKTEVVSPEEGEVAEEAVDWRKESKQTREGILGSGDNGFLLRKHFAIERALADLVLPCLAHCTPETYSGFAIELVKQMSELEQHVSLLTCSFGKPTLAVPEASVSKGLGFRKGPRAGLDCSNPATGRSSVTLVSDSSPPSTGALQTSMWLRLQFLLPLLPLIHADREPTPRNMRSMLAPVLLRLLGTRVVQESVETIGFPQSDYCVAGPDFEGKTDVAAVAAASVAGEALFDRLLIVFHALLSNTRAVWLKQKKPTCKGTSKPIPALDRELVERMQADLDHMQLSPTVRVRLQAAMPVLSTLSTLSISAGPPQVLSAALNVLQTGVVNATNMSISSSLTISHKASFRPESSMGKGKLPPLQDPDLEIDPWLLLEDGTGSGSTGGGSGALVRGESGNMKACAWLKGAVRVRRTDLTYVGSLDDYT